MDSYTFVFSGQGSQYTGMCKELYQKSDAAKKNFDMADDILKFKISELCFFGDEKLLSDTINAQLAVFTTSCAQMEDFFQNHNYFPKFVAGNSVGEYAALVCAGVLTFKDALLLVKTRSELMCKAAENKNGAMAVIRNIDLSIVQDELEKQNQIGKSVYISNYNGLNNVVVSGVKDNVLLLCDKLKSHQAEVITLKVSSAFHSPLMQEAADKFADEIEKYTFSTAKCSIMSNVSGEPYQSVQEIKQTLAIQIICPVKWNKIMKYLEQQGVNRVIEFGPKATLRNYFLNNTSIVSLSYDVVDDRTKIIGFIEDSNLSVPALCLGAAVSAKNKNPDISLYKENVIKPYKVIEKIYRESENNLMEDDINTCYLMLKQILECKMLPNNEINLVVGQIFKGKIKGQPL